MGILLALILILFAAFSRLIPHAPNFTPVISIAFRGRLPEEKIRLPGSGRGAPYQRSCHRVLWNRDDGFRLRNDYPHGRDGPAAREEGVGG